MITDKRSCMEAGPGLQEFRDGCTDTTDVLGVRTLICICSDKDNCNTATNVRKPGAMLVLIPGLYAFLNIIL